MNNKLQIRHTKLLPSFSSSQTHRHTTSLGLNTEFKMESPTNRETALNSFQSMKSSKQWKQQKYPQTRTCAGSTHETLLFSQRGSTMQMVQTYSKHYDLIQQSEPLETIHYNQQVEQNEKNKENNFDFIHDGTLQLFELKAEIANTIYIQRFRFHYFFIRILDQESPLQVYVKSGGAKMNQIRIYVSTTAQYPTKFNCEAIIQSKYFKYTEKQHQDNFVDKNLYFSIYSEEDCEMQTQIVFGNKLQKRFKFEKEKPNYEKYRQFLSQCKFDVTLTDKIVNNLDVRQFSKESRKSKLLQLSGELDQRLRNVLIKKKDILQDKKLDLISKYQAHQTLKVIRKQQQTSSIKKSLVQRFQKNWVRVFLLFHFCENINRILQEHKKKNKYLAKGRLIVWRYKTTTMIKIKESGATVDDRNRFKICNTIAMYVNHIKKCTKRKAGLLLHTFLKVTHIYMTVVIKHKEFTDKVNYVKKIFKNLKLKQKAYRERLFRALQKNANEILNDLNIPYTNPKKKSYQLDQHNLTRAMDDFIMNKKRRLQQYVVNYVREKEKRQKIVDLALNMMQPELFDTPNYNELYGIFKIYAHFKRLLKI